MSGRLRWRIARWLDDHRPDACWADLASWAMGHDGYRLRDAAGVRSRSCQQDIDTGTGCWCGKVRGDKKWMPCQTCGGCGGAFGASFIEGGCSACAGRGAVLVSIGETT